MARRAELVITFEAGADCAGELARRFGLSSFSVTATATGAATGAASALLAASALTLA